MIWRALHEYVNFVFEFMIQKNNTGPYLSGLRRCACSEGACSRSRQSISVSGVSGFTRTRFSCSLLATVVTRLLMVLRCAAPSARPIDPVSCCRLKSPPNARRSSLLAYSAVAENTISTIFTLARIDVGKTRDNGECLLLFTSVGVFAS